MTADGVPVDREKYSNDDTISTLNGLIEICKDGQQGFKEAAEGVENSQLKTTFYEFSQQRAEFAGVLQESVRRLGGDPETSSSVAGAMHRAWVDLKAALTGGSEEAILNECERGEDYAKDAYIKACDEPLPADIASIVKQQSQSVLAAHNRIRDLRNAADRSESAGSGR
ncbi:MAG: ferritin-like domain-containing protein [Pyrinomonadaceae bacterium]